MNNANIIVELDALQDTALGVIAAHNAGLGVKAVMDEEFWHSRVVEGMGSLLPPDVFDTIYASRASNGMEVLRNSPLTGVPLMIGKFIASHAANADARFYDSKMAVHINIWPYEMTPEVRDIYKRTAYNWFNVGPITDLQIVRFSPSELTPKYLNGAYTQMYIRDIRPWFKAQAEALAKYQIPLFTMVAPRIVRNTDKALFDSIPSDKKNLDLFEETTRWHSGIIGLDFIDNRFFSYIPVPTEDDLAMAEEIIGQEGESENV